MTQHTVMLDFDGVFNMPAFSSKVEWDAFRAGTTPSRDDGLPWVKTAPDDTERVTLKGLADGNVYGVVRRATIDALRDFVNEEDVRLVWATSWLTRPERLEAAAALIGLEFIEIPDLGKIVPFNEPLYAITGHWKTDLVYTYVNAGDRVLWIDDQLELRPAQRHLEHLSVIAPSTYFGLNSAHMDLCHQWLRGRDLAVFDSERHLGWNGTGAAIE